MAAGVSDPQECGIETHTECVYERQVRLRTPQRPTHPLKQLGWKQGQSCGLRDHHRAPLDVREPEASLTLRASSLRKSPSTLCPQVVGLGLKALAAG